MTTPAFNPQPCCDVAAAPLAVSSQALSLTPEAGWSPVHVTGTLTSLTIVVLTGTLDLTDANGTELDGLPAGLTMTWTAEDGNALTGPIVAIPAADSTAVAFWTEHPAV